MVTGLVCPVSVNLSTRFGDPVSSFLFCPPPLEASSPSIRERVLESCRCGLLRSAVMARSGLVPEGVSHVFLEDCAEPSDATAESQRHELSNQSDKLCRSVSGCLTALLCMPVVRRWCVQATARGTNA